MLRAPPAQPVHRPPPSNLQFAFDRVSLTMAPMLFSRQRVLLALLDRLGGTVAHTDFQKLLFLYTHEWESEPSYEFVPYHFGGFSFTSYADKRRLTERGYLAENESEWELTANGRTASRREHDISARMQRFVEAIHDVRGDRLIAEVYRRHPYYAIRSRVAARILTPAENARVISARPTSRGPGLLTIGYEGKTLERYLNQLIGAGVTVLCDVRRNPLSRKYGFSKSTLRQACEGVGIRYEHLPELGIASEDRRELEVQEDYDSLFATYRRVSLPRQGAALARIRHWVECDGETVALTCFEAQPCQCHRHCVAEALATQGGTRLVPYHL
jgi:uncharacterized protein (DUF488 family)